MGLDTIPNRINGQTIDQDWFNLLRRVLNSDVVPRNTSGVPTPAGGSLGDSTNLWQNLFLNFLKLAANSNLITLKPPATLSTSYGIQLPNALPSSSRRLSIDSSGIISFEDIASNLVVSASSGHFTTTSTGYVNVTNLSATITTRGRPVMLVAMADTSSNSSSSFTLSGNDRIGILFRSDQGGTTNIGTYQIGAGSFDWPGNLMIIDQNVIGIPGTYTYTIWAKSFSGSLVAVDYVVLAAYEL